MILIGMERDGEWTYQGTLTATEGTIYGRNERDRLRAAQARCQILVAYDEARGREVMPAAGDAERHLARRRCLTVKGDDDGGL